MILIVLGVVCLVLAVGLLFWGMIAGKRNKIELKKKDIKNPRVAVLIPARDESEVIEGLLKSLARQTVKVKPQDIYVIVESLNDPTVEICVKYRNNVIVRKDLRENPERQRKGFALDIAVKEILQKEIKYDVFFVFDADNILEEDYLEKMLDCYKQGYELATGYRNSKNGNKNVVAAASSLTFSMINVIGNRGRIKNGANVVFSGTGFFVDGELVREWGGWPFHGLTEDYEMSLYATLHGLKTYYNDKAVFYDEQPLRYKQTEAQRVRWIRGYFDARKKYVPLIRQMKHAENYGSLQKEIVGVWPVIWAILGVVLIVLGLMVGFIKNGKWWGVLAVLGGLILLVYIVLMIATILILKQEKLDLDKKMKIRTVLFNPIYLVGYVPCAIRALLARDVQWTKIKHGEQE